MASQQPGPPERPSRPPRPQAVLTVSGQEWINTCTVRVVAGGPGFTAIRLNDYTDAYAKLIFLDPALEISAPYDLSALRDALPPEQHPVTRTYTLRRIDSVHQQVTIDFVVHGDEGIAAPWAAQAQPGDTLVLSGAGGAYRPDPEHDWHLFAGDESALPAICSALEALPSDARAVAYLETSDTSETLDATDTPATLDLLWLHRETPGTTPHLLAETVAAGPWLPGRVDVFAHGERESMKALRAALKRQLSPTDSLSLSGYWAYGRTEDTFQAEKRQPIGQIEPPG